MFIDDDVVIYRDMVWTRKGPGTINRARTFSLQRNRFLLKELFLSVSGEQVLFF